MSNVVENGFWYTDATQHDLSATGTHYKTYVACITPAAFTDFHVRLGDAQTTYERHDIGVGFYDNEQAGWQPVWVEVGAGVDVGGGPSAYTAIDEFAATCDMSTVGGNLKNFQIDQSHYATRPVFLWDGTAGDLDDFITTEGTAGVGVLKLVNGVYFCFANFKVGSATATTFTHTKVTLAWPDATWLPAASTWMGVDIDLQHASTVVDLTSNVFQSANPAGAAARKPDFLVTGTSGSLDISQSSFVGMRVVDLTDAVTANNCVFSNCGVIDATVAGTAGADLDGSSVLVSAVAANASALIWDVNADPDTYLPNMKFSMGGNAHHAIEFGTTSPLALNLTGIDFTGFGAGNDANDSTFHVKRTTDTVTITLDSCTGNFSYRTDGATVNVVEGAVTVKVTTKKTDGTALGSANVHLRAKDATGPFPYQEVVTITRAGSVATVSHTGHGMASNDKVLIVGTEPTEEEYLGVHTITKIDDNSYSYTVSGTPTTPASGTINATFVALDGTTNATTGILSTSRVYSSNQPVTGWARKSTSSPYYQQGILTGEIDSTTGYDVAAVMVLDE